MVFVGAGHEEDMGTVLPNASDRVGRRVSVTVLRLSVILITKEHITRALANRVWLLTLD